MDNFGFGSLAEKVDKFGMGPLPYGLTKSKDGVFYIAYLVPSEGFVENARRMHQEQAAVWITGDDQPDALMSLFRVLFFGEEAPPHPELLKKMLTAMRP